MQTSDIVVAAHGAGEANLMFMRPKRSVIEVFPFGFTPKLFETVALLFNLNYQAVVARPERETVENCIQDPELLLHFKELADHLEGEVVEEKKMNHDLWTYQSRICLRKQALQFDVKRVTGLVVKEAERILGHLNL